MFLSCIPKKKLQDSKSTTIPSRLLNFRPFPKLFVAFSPLHWDQFSHWQPLRRFLQPVTGGMRKLMFPGGTELALLFALFVQLHLFAVCVNISLRVLLCCHCFTFHWKHAARVQHINNTVIFGDFIFPPKEPFFNYYSVWLFWAFLFSSVVLLSMLRSTPIQTWLC